MVLDVKKMVTDLDFHCDKNDSDDNACAAIILLSGKQKW